jgi:hypothetical protein
MNRKMTITLMLTTSMLLSLVSFTTAQGQNRRRPVADTALVTLGPNQVLRLTVATGDVNGDAIAVQFRQVGYDPAGCNGGVCKHTIVSQSTSAPVTLMPGDAASIDIESHNWGVRAIVLSDNQNVRVNAMIVDMTTGNIIGVLIGDSGPAR